MSYTSYIDFDVSNVSFDKLLATKLWLKAKQADMIKTLDKDNKDLITDTRLLLHIIELDLEKINQKIIELESDN